LIDRSNSMGYASGPDLQYGAKMEYAKRAALAVVDQLGPRDLVGAIAFDSEPYELGPLLPLAEGRAALTAKIRQLRYGGGTDFKEALDRARRSLVAAGRRGASLGRGRRAAGPAARDLAVRARADRRPAHRLPGGRRGLADVAGVREALVAARDVGGAARARGRPASGGAAAPGGDAG